ncbi:SPFH domain-containing protein [Vibrio sp. SCSIO 43137]|uniref:SPFH domain-containing protein n=1 Tax=Vibrio sp. SCSIO 43137 TaxID=3021011 RepID=UPI0023081167|nr:SPFH domain-containing protein [Vibrio sp. SCSIO 43137]WCE28433.1 SPFH domain-containing protein [Vibrio sp. SCSIO 43137]
MNMKSIVTGGLVAIGLVTVLALKPFTTVGAGEVKVPVVFGKVQQQELYEGFHLVNPLASFDTYDIKENAYELNNVTIPSKDKFKSNANVTIMWSVDGNATPKLRGTVGTMAEVEHKLLRQPLLSLLREAGRSVEKAQDLFDDKTQVQLQTDIMDGLTKATENYGVKIHAVYIQDIELPRVIRDAIVRTKQLEEQEAQEQARLAQEKLIYARDTAKAEAKAKSAEHNATARKANADAALYEKQQAADASEYRQKKDADAKLYAANKEAQGNKAIAKSLTSNLLEARRIDVDMQRMKSWKGAVPSTLMAGEGTQAVPLYHMGNK